MKTFPEIKSRHNPHVKNVLNLKKTKNRRNAELFLIEGYRELQKAVNYCFELKFLLVCLELINKNEEISLIECIEKTNIPIFSVTKTVFCSLCYKENPDPLLAVAIPRYQTKVEFFSREHVRPHLYLLAESIEKPGNLGALLRNCDAVALDGLIVCDLVIDIFNPNVIRSSLGTLFSVPVLLATNEEIFPVLREKGFQLVVTTPSGDVSYLDTNFTVPTVIIMGSENKGVSSFWLEKGDVLSKIPVLGAADSLNVAMSATIFLYEALRQRASFQ